MKKNMVYVALSVIGVQGAAYLGQFILAGMLPAEQFAIVRTVEASLQLLSTIAPLGVSLLVVRLAAQTTDLQALERALSSYLAFALVAGIAIAGICSLLIGAFGQRDAAPYMLGMVWVLVLTNISRTALNFLYGKELFATVSVTNLIIALCYLVALVALVKMVGLPGWIGAKYLVETAFLMVSLAFVWRHLGRVIESARLYVDLAREGLAVSMSLLFRTGLDTMPLLTLAYLGTNAHDIATFGLCTLAVAAAMILPASLNTVLLPRYAQVLNVEPHALLNLHSANQKHLTVIGIAVALILIFFGWVVKSVIDENFFDSTVMLAVMAISIPLKALGAVNANVLFARHKTATGTKVNAFAFFVSTLLTWTLIEEFGVWAAVIGTLTGEFVSFSLMIAFAKREVARMNDSLPVRQAKDGIN